MKTYSSITKVTSRPNFLKRKSSWLIFLFGLFIFSLVFPWLMSKVSAFVLYPFHVTSTWIKTSDSMIPLYLRSRSELVNEVEELQKKLATQNGTQMSIQRLLQENMQLRALSQSDQINERLVARVLNRPNNLPNDLIQIDQGVNHGVQVGAPVYSGMDSVVGLVVYTAPEYAFVDLFTSPNFLSTAYILGPDVFAPIEGLGGGIARVKLPQGVKIREGQLVILPGVSSAVYGEIVSVQNEPTQPEQYGYVAPAQALNSLLYVTVGLDTIMNREVEPFETEMRDRLRDITNFSYDKNATSSPFKETESTEDLTEDNEVTSTEE